MAGRKPKEKGKYNTRYADLTPEEIENLTIEECIELINEKQRIFALEYSKHYEPKKAAISAGYSEHSAAISGAKNKRHPIISRYLELLNQDRFKRLEIDGDDILREYAKIGFFNIKECFDAEGNILPVDKMPDRVTAGISKIKERVLKKSDTATVIDREYSFHDKVQALRDLGKNKGIFEKDNEQKQANVMLYMPDNNRGKKEEKDGKTKQTKREGTNPEKD